MEIFLLAVTAIATSIGAGVSVFVFFQKLIEKTKILTVTGEGFAVRKGNVLAASVRFDPRGKPVLIKTIKSPGRKLSFEANDEKQDCLQFNIRIESDYPFSLFVSPCPKDGEPLHLTIDVGQLLDLHVDLYAFDFWRGRIPNQTQWR